MSKRRPAPSAQRQREARRQRFEKEVDRLLDRLYGCALRLTRDPDEAEEIVAETVSKAWSHLHELREPDRLPAWLFRILNTTFISHWRRCQARQRNEAELIHTAVETEAAEDFSLFERLHQPFLLWWATPEERFLNDLLHEDIVRALDSLPDAYRLAVVFVEIEGYTYAEAAHLLEIPVGTVRSRLNRGRSLLQRALWEQGREAGFIPALSPPHSPGGEH